MSSKMTRDQAYAKGRAAAEQAAKNATWLDLAESVMDWAKQNSPTSAHLDYRAEVQALETQRLDADLDLTKFPECRGLRELVAAEHKGFFDTCGDPWMTAHHFNWYWFVSRRLNTRYVAAASPPAQCTSVFISDSDEGPLFGRNLDDLRRPFEKFDPPQQGPADKPFRGITSMGAVSSAVLCDEEPQDIFPVDPLELLPEDLTDIDEFVAFMQRYADFWGPCNSVWMNPDLDSVSLEKSNCRVGVRKAINGASAVTACSYITPEMNRFHQERAKISIKARNLPAACADQVYWDGCEKRYHRLLELVDELVRQGPTLEGLNRIVLDHEVPFPDRICLAGEEFHPDALGANWTLESHVSVLTGPTRRTLWHRVEGDTPVYQTTPFLVLGPGVPVRDEWLPGTRPPSER